MRNANQNAFSNNEETEIHFSQKLQSNARMLNALLVIIDQLKIINENSLFQCVVLVALPREGSLKHKIRSKRARVKRVEIIWV